MADRKGGRQWVAKVLCPANVLSTCFWGTPERTEVILGAVLGGHIGLVGSTFVIVLICQLCEYTAGCIFRRYTFFSFASFKQDLLRWAASQTRIFRVKDPSTSASSDLLYVAGHVNAFLRQLTLWLLSLLMSAFLFKLFAFFPFVSTWQIEQVYSTANARISWRVAHSFSSTHCSFNLSTLFCKFALEKMGFNICVDIKSFKCKGCNQHPEIWNGTRQCSVRWPGKQSAWLRGAWRGQLASALPCSKLSFSYNISNKCDSILKKIFSGEIQLPPEATALLCTCCSQLPIDR